MYFILLTMSKFLKENETLKQVKNLQERKMELTVSNSVLISSDIKEKTDAWPC